MHADGVSASVYEFFKREVEPHVPDAWIDTSKRDHKDGYFGMVGYEINFKRYFYRYRPPRPIAEIEAEIQASYRTQTASQEKSAKFPHGE